MIDNTVFMNNISVLNVIKQVSCPFIIILWDNHKEKYISTEANVLGILQMETNFDKYFILLFMYQKATQQSIDFIL